jgi:putative ABC transport system permease protein
VKFLPLIWRTLGRRRTRTVFTLLSIVVAFVLFGYLSAIDVAFGMGVEIVGADRLITIHKVSLIQLLPYRYQDRIAAIPGVKDVATSVWFGGVYQDPKNFIAQMAVEPERFLRVYPEFVLPEDQRRAWLADRTGCIVGRKTAERFGFDIGDRIPIQGTFYRKSDGSSLWEFTVRGIYSGARKGVDETQMFFHYEYLDEAREHSHGTVGWFVLRVDDPARSAEIARAIDTGFANSEDETKTSTEKVFVEGFANQLGNISAILRAVMLAVFFTILLVAGNTMAQSVRERTAELALLKTLGFTDGQVLALVLAESMVLAGLGGFVGLAVGWLLITVGGDPTGGLLAVFYVPSRDLVLGAVLAGLLGLACGAIPALQARRLAIADALRRAGA